MKLARRHVAAETVIIYHLEFVDGAEIPRVCLSLSNTVATFTQALAVSLAHPIVLMNASGDTCWCQRVSGTLAPCYPTTETCSALRPARMAAAALSTAGCSLPS